uniref:Uncharacterized protein n=1 Tax=Anopheles coluzzii TaxID=1518534 RepID=A0A8W7P4V5_ANOCL
MANQCLIIPLNTLHVQQQQQQQAVCFIYRTPKLLDTSPTQQNITLPSSPRPFRHNLSIAQLSDLDDSLMSDAAAALSKCRAGDATPSSQGSNLCNSSSSSKFTKQLQTK